MSREFFDKMENIEMHKIWPGGPELPRKPPGLEGKSISASVPNANRSNLPPATTVYHVKLEKQGKIGKIFRSVVIGSAKRLGQRQKMPISTGRQNGLRDRQNVHQK